MKNTKEREKVSKVEYCDFVADGRKLLKNPNSSFVMADELDKKEMINKSYQRAF